MIFCHPNTLFRNVYGDMMKIKTMPAVKQNDAELVADSLNGSRDAFCRIVERYQTLICSLAYSATGSVSRSEDMAQETFLAAWQQLPALRERAKLRAWLCGIARHRIQKCFERDGREPACNAATLADAHDSRAIEALPSEQAINREEEAILWRSLGKIPELYREPLILYYREHQSIDFDFTLKEINQSDKTATLLIRHVPPEKSRVKLSADWMQKPVADTANNWVQVQKTKDGKYSAGVGKETFDVEIKVDLTDGKILSATMDNPVVTVERECEDAAAAKCGDPKPHLIERQIEIYLER